MERFWKTKWIVSGTAAISLLYFQNGFMVRLLLGAGLNSVFVKVLKRLFGQARPEVAVKAGKLDPGFPSSHAHMLFFLSVFIAMDLDVRDEALEVLLLAFKGGLLLAAVFGSLLRVLAFRHTPVQVVAGAISGTFGAWIFHSIFSEDQSHGFDDFIEEIRIENPLSFLLSSILAGIAGFLFLSIYGKRITGKLSFRGSS